MGNLLYIVAFILIVIWATVLLATDAGGKIHVILVVAITVFILGFILRKPNHIRY